MWVVENEDGTLRAILRSAQPFTDAAGTQHPKDVLLLWSLAELAAVGVKPLVPAPAPDGDAVSVDGVTGEKQPDGTWLLVWITSPLPQAQIDNKLPNVRLDRLEELGHELDRRLDAVEDRAAFEQNRELSLAGLLSRKTFDQTQWPAALSQARASYLTAVQGYADLFQRARTLRLTIKGATLAELRALDVTAEAHWV